MKVLLGCLLLLVQGLVNGVAAETNQWVARIGFLSDTHLNLRTNEPGLSYNRRADQAIDEVNRAGVDLVLIAGDLTDGGKPEQMRLFQQKVKRFQAPVLFVPGNHDVGMVGRGKVKTSITEGRVKRFAKTLGPNWFDREQAGVRVIGVDSCLFESGLPEEAEQWTFLEQALARPVHEPTFLLEHYPLFLKTVAEGEVGTWNVGPEPRRRLLGLLQRGGVQTVLTGHLHYPITNRVEGILFLGNGTTAFGLPPKKQPEGWMLLQVPRQGEVQFDFRRLD